MKPSEKQKRLTAALALSADKKAEELEEKCLSAEDMALLIESKLPAAKLEESLDHLARCESCYQQWVLLQKTAVPKKNIIRFPGPRAFKYIGSSLAVAASVVVFLNIREPEMLKVPAVIQDKESIRTQAEIGQDAVVDSLSLEKLEAPMEEFDKEKEDLPTVPARKERFQSLEATTKSLEESVPSDRANRQEGKVARLQWAKPSAETVMKRRNKTVEVDFASKIVKGCTGQNFEPEYWSKLLKDMNQSERELKEELTDKDAAALQELITTIDETSWKSHCERIVELLAKQGQSR